MTRTAPLSLVLALALALPVGGCGDDRASTSRAREALARGDVEAARQALRSLRERRPETADALLEQASLLLAAGEAPHALWLLEEGVERFPDRDDLRVQLARTALVVANPALARDAVSTVPETSPEHLSALLVRAQAELGLGDLDAGLETLRLAETLYPDRAEASAARIAALLREGRLEEAAAVTREAKARAPTREAARSLELVTAALEAAQGDDDSALARLRGLVDEDPDDALALQTLVQALLRKDGGEEALERVAAAAARHPDEPAFAAMLAQVHLEGGRPEAAEAAIRRMIEISESPSAYLALARFHERGEDLEAVARTYAEAVSRFPDSEVLRMHHAESLIELGRREAALAALEEFRALAPEDPHVEYLRARLALADGRASEAADRLGRVVSRLDRVYTQYWLGRALEASGDVAGAERRYGLALVRHPSHTAAVTALLRLAEHRGDWAAVAGHALAFARRAPDRVEGYATAITALVRAGQTEAAEELARRFAKRFPERASAPALLAFALRSQGRFEEARAVLAEAAAEHGDDPALAAESGLLDAAEGRLAEAAVALRTAAAAYPDAADVQTALAAVLFGVGDGAGGSAAVDRALALRPDDPAPLELRARFRASTGDPEGARRDAERYLAARPDDANGRFLLGALLARTGERELAIAEYRRAGELDESAYAARNNLAVLLLEEGDIDAALAAAQEAYALAGSDPNVVDTLGWIYLQKGLAQRSVALLERAHAAAPGAPEPQLHLALAYRELGRDGDARRLLADLVARVEAGTALGTRARDALGALDE